MTDKIELLDVRLIFKNFSGKATEVTPRGGVRSFCAVLTVEDADSLSKNGWNVKQLAPREEGDDITYFLPIALNYDGPYPPSIYIVDVNKRATLLNKDTIGMLDATNILTSDLIIRSYRYDVQGSKGIKAYLEAGYISLEPSRVREKYADYNES